MYPGGGSSIPLPLPVPVSAPTPLAVHAPSALPLSQSLSLSVPLRPSVPVPVTLSLPSPAPVPLPVQPLSLSFSVPSATPRAAPLPVPLPAQPSSPWSFAASVPHPVQSGAPRAVGASARTPSHPPPVTAPPVPAHTPSQTPPYAVPIPLVPPPPTPFAVPRAVAPASPPVAQPVPRTPAAPALLLSVPSLPSTPAASRAAPPLVAVAAAPSVVASPRPVPLVNLSTAASPAHASAAPVSPPPVPSSLTPLHLSVSQLIQPAAPLPVPLPTPVSVSHASVTAIPQPVASPLRSILVSSAPAPAPVPLNRAASTAAPLSVTFALPGEPRVAGASPPRVGSVPAPPLVVPLAPTPVSVPTPVPVPTPMPVPVPVPTPLAAPQLSVALPVLHATEEEPPFDVPPPDAEADARGHLPDYAAWLFPTVLKGSSICAPALKFPLADGAAPHVVVASGVLRWLQEEVLAALPTTLPPEYVIFGGAKYSGAPLDLVRPPLVVAPNARRTAAFYEAAEDQRLQFLADQLEVARRYLKIEARRATDPQQGGLSFAVPFLSPSAGAGAGDVIVKPGESEDVAKANIWTAAYFGSPPELAAVLEKLTVDGALESAGLVSYRRRQWGLKRAGSTFELGLGMRGTPLQFAAAAGKLDSVVFLLANGARDRTAPRLKEILSPESMQVIEAVCKPRSRATRPVRASTAETGDDHAVAPAEEATGAPQPPQPSYMNVQVYDIDEP